MMASFLPLAAIAAPLEAQSIEPSLQYFVRAIGNEAAEIGRREGSDMVVFLIQGEYEPEVGGVAKTATGSTVDPGLDDSAIALLRTRSTNDEGTRKPDALDIALSRTTEVPVFIVGNWQSPPAIWEMRVTGNRVSWRVVDKVGLVGPWQVLVQ